MGRKVGLIVALDVLDKDRALKVASEVEDFVDGIKVNYPLVLSVGLQIVGELAKIKPVVADFKIADIPYTSSLIAEIAFKSKANALICHGFVGRDTIKSVLDVARKFDGEIYVVTELSSDGAREYMAKHSRDIAKMAKELGCHGIIAPATRKEKVVEFRKIVGDLKILSPGIGAQKGDIEVVKHVDYIIVGRSIYNAEKPKIAAEQIISKISEVLDV